ncbi:MAG: prepilin peptidase [Candidatus Syntrophosphaera sp.]
MDILIILIIAVLGASLGSFFNVLIDRVPRKESIVSPGSHCSECGKSLPAWQNIPIFSYLFLGGKCKYCGTRIHWHHLVVEIATPLLFIGLFMLYGLQSLAFWKFAVMFAFLIPIFFIDAFHKIIPLVLSIPMAIMGLILSFIQSGFEFRYFLWVYLIPTFALFGLLYLLALGWEKVFHKEGLGGGDVILIPAVAAFFGAIHIPFVIVLACLMGIFYFMIFIRRTNQVFAFGNFIASAAIIWVFAGEYVLARLRILI